jgi:HD-like signal output (HDOD) protein
VSARSLWEHAVTKSREHLSATEIAELRQDLARRLEGVGVQSQPQIALTILDLIRKPDSQLKDYAAIVGKDPALSGRLLKLANSAYFAQRQPVSSLDRACLLLGVERLKAMSLGFHLAKAATSDPSAKLSRVVWGQSVFRACLAAEIARRTAPRLAAEAFIIGLLMDAGLALMPRLAGDGFQRLWDSGLSPARLNRAEIAELSCGHVDVAAALALTWKLPDVLRIPISEHHTPPSVPVRNEPVARLQAIAYTVGLIDLSPTADGGVEATPERNGPTMRAIERLLSLESGSVAPIVQRAAEECTASKDIFKDVAQSMTIDDALLERVQTRMIDAIDGLLVQTMSLATDTPPEVASFRLGGEHVELHRGNDGSIAAYLYDSQGEKLLTHVFQPKGQTSSALRDALALDPHPEDELAQIDAYIRAA